MINKEISKIFYEIADYLSMDDKETFRIYAYRKAASVIESLQQDVSDIYNKKGINGLIEIQGIGKGIALLIKEYISKGKINYYQQLKKETPVDLENLMRIEGLGSKTIKTLYQQLNIKNVLDLKKAIKNNEIASLFNFGEKKVKNILQGIEFLEQNKNRLLLGDILPYARTLQEKIQRLPQVIKVDMAGSLRRKKETIGDVDFLISAKKNDNLIDSLISISQSIKVINQGETKLSLKTKQQFNIDFRIVEPQSYGSALQYFTGSKEHNIQLRKLAIKKGYKINEYGIFRNKKKIAGAEEKEIYQTLNINFIPPEIREGTNEIQSFSCKNKIKLIELKDIKGDLHCHSTWSGGENTIKEMAQQAIDLNYSYIGIADHTKYLRIENGLDEKQLAQQRKEISKLNKEIEINILQGCEANILKNGDLDIKDQALEKLDYVIAGIHSHFKMDKKEMTDRTIKAMKNPLVKIIAHPTGRILNKRDEYQIDFNKILRVARETKTILEINSYPERLDLNDLKIRAAKKEKVKMIINSDAHHKSQMNFMEFGVFQARRGWLEKKDVINSSSCLPFFQLKC